MEVGEEQYFLHKDGLFLLRAEQGVGVVADLENPWEEKNVS